MNRAKIEAPTTVSINKLRLYQIVFVSILLAKIFTTKIIFHKFSGCFC